MTRTGITLVEVVAGMTLLASLATGVVLAYGAHQKQLRRAELRIDAVHVADQLLAQWYSGEEAVPRNRRGRVFAEGERWIWKTETTEVALIGSLPVERIRVEVHWEWIRHDQPPLAVVELIAPLDETTSAPEI